MKARNRLNVDDKDEAGFSKCSTANFEIGCQNASASIALTQLLRLPLELYSGKSLLMCFLYLLKIFSYANIGGGVAGYSATVKGVATRKSLGTTALDSRCVNISSTSLTLAYTHYDKHHVSSSRSKI